MRRRSRTVGGDGLKLLLVMLVVDLGEVEARTDGAGADPAQRWPEAVNKGHEIEQVVSFMASPVPANKRRRELREGTERGKGRRGRRRGAAA